MWPRLLTALLCLFLFALIKVNAQAAAPEIRGILPEKGIYRFNSFNEGSIIYRNGIMSSGKMNYNVSLDEIHFINEKGDTLSLSEPESISFINLNASRFYYDKGFLQTVDTVKAKDVVLAFKQVFMTQQRRSVGAYGMTEQHEGIRNYNLYSGNGQTITLTGDEKILVTTRENYYFGDAYGHFAKASKGYILDHFESKRAEINEFIKARHINFNVLKDLLKLMEFLNQ